MSESIEDFLSRLSPEERAELYSDSGSEDVVNEINANAEEARTVAEFAIGHNGNDDLPEEL